MKERQSRWAVWPRRRPARTYFQWGISLATPLLTGCSNGSGAREHEGPLIVYNAGSLARPIRAALDTFALLHGVRVEQESAGSLETARKLTELRKIPDVIALADHEVFPQLLMPHHVSWYVPFARNRMVIAYTPRSRFAAELTVDNWWRILSRSGVEVGRSDPNLDPNGYRTLLVLQLAERYYDAPGLAATVLARAPPRNMRPKEADLVGLVEAGELDYIWSYESMARAAGLPYLTLPSAIDLSSPADSTRYATASVRVIGSSPGDTLELRGAPILYAFSVPHAAPHPELAQRFAAFLLSDDGRRVLRRTHLDVLVRSPPVGSGAPTAVHDRPTP